ncbi:MAG: class I SAM-dependent RNA methyltransferase [Bacilli bacterium]|nr:class I SAM-dependent RNA methyltransferase [Bacilli bacterium]
MKINDIYEVIIDSVDINGNGVTRINNIVTFIPNALENEKLKIKITEIEKHFAYAEILEIINSSNLRNEVKCPYYNKCGGCNFLHTSYENEINVKLSNLERLFNRKINYISNEDINNYRNKVTLHVLEGKIGYFNNKTHDLCEIDNCLLLNPKINLKIHDLNNYDLNGIEEIMIRCINNKIMINIKGKNINKNIKSIECDSLYINDEFISGEKYLIDEINNLKFSIYPNSFYQVNKEVMTNIYNKAKEYAGLGNNLIDLYCGTGTIGLWLKDNFKNITGIEINNSSIKNANINKELNNAKNINFKLGDASIINKYINNIDTILVDPPRAGLSKSVINTLNNSKSNKIVYISCNPKTLKRDIDKLDNYNIIEISACNMFPRTKHIECVCLLERI